MPTADGSACTRTDAFGLTSAARWWRAAGSTVRIALDGAADGANAIQLTEVANQANTDTGAHRSPKDVLSIVEAEFYGAP
ncbi:hypothetical protein LJR289_001548 [Pseudoduganella sp. LjRoot289]|uniref:hypothetical protein n=1 Tax=Pseudoduganella sp. LjRoot289 TaxID=3342314 RepID=UPI003ECFACB2